MELSTRVKNLKFATEIGQREFDTNETIMQIVGMGKMAYWCWGVSKKINYYNKALMLQVNGRHHKGKVWIALAWDDTYTVYITTNQLKVLKTYEMVYFDMLNGIIDGYIENRRNEFND